MFKLVDCFLTSGVFNDALIKRFKENYDAKNGSRLWMIPGHVIYTTPDQKVYTCDARPLDLLSPSEPCTGELLSSVTPVINIFFETVHESLRMHIALSNGDVQIFEYRALLYEWARVGYFNVNITSPNNIISQQYIVHKVFISSQQNKIYWCEKEGDGDFNLTLYCRSLPLNSVREITQTAIGASQTLLKSCPNFEIFDIGENICIIPKLPNSVNLYLILSARFHLWVFDITGKCLWRGVIAEQSMDFFTLCMKIAGLWTLKGSVLACKSLYHHHKTAYIIHDNTLLKITPSGEISSKTEIELSFDGIEEIYVLWTIVCVVTKDLFMLYSLENFKLLQTISLECYMPIRGTLSHASIIPCLGIYNDSTAYMLQPQSLSSILSTKEALVPQVLNILSNRDVHLYALMRDIVQDKLNTDDLLPLQNIPGILQSKALLLALFHLCKSKGINIDNFPFHLSCQDELFNSSNSEAYPDTMLKEILEPLVECYCKIEEARKKL